MNNRLRGKHRQKGSGADKSAEWQNRDKAAETDILLSFRAQPKAAGRSRPA